MNLQKKFIVYAIGLILLSVVSYFLFNGFLSKFTSKSGSLLSGIGLLSNTPVFQSGIFSDDGNYFAYTYRPEVEMLDIKGSVKITGYAYPTYFRVVETATGKVKSDIYESGKYDQLYVVWADGDLVWLMERVDGKGNRLALFDLNTNKFRFPFGKLEQLNPSILKGAAETYYINNTPQPGFIFEGSDKRFYRIDPIAEPPQSSKEDLTI